MFDERTVTEEECDFVQFFKDASCVTTWGREKYSGGRGNWPGCGGSPPLEIPGDSFVFHFHSDASRTAWGYRCRILPVMPGETAATVMTRASATGTARATMPSASVSASGAHTGEYRDVTVLVRRSPDGRVLGAISSYCGRGGDGPACEHPGGTCEESHWSCCGRRSFHDACTRMSRVVDVERAPVGQSKSSGLCVRARVCACVCACVRVCVHVCVPVVFSCSCAHVCERE